MRLITAIAKALYIMLFCITGALAVTQSSSRNANDNSYKLPILLYHHILSDAENETQKNNACVVSLEDFEEQMKYLHDEGFHCISVDELNDFLFKKANLPPKSVMITFDDGYYSNVVRAYPVMKKYGITGVWFVIGNTVSETQNDFNPNGFTWTSAENLEKVSDVFTIASHTYDMHKPADDSNTVFMVSDYQAIKEDLLKSFTYVTNKEIFAYPLGQYNDDSIKILGSMGIKMAVTTKYGYVTTGDSPAELGRIIIYQCMPLKRFIDIVNGRG